ncbi:uncharacterized protein EKO05_0010102 [Ascochyta rabiei]|nr:uncharacterized protein EKO05_0010102 [Ascochyta rabiei]UPX19851.1 hypothetical protein EKO05_0010102 [Ascochyta rabiei]
MDQFYNAATAGTASVDDSCESTSQSRENASSSNARTSSRCSGLEMSATSKSLADSIPNTELDEDAFDTWSNLSSHLRLRDRTSGKEQPWTYGPGQEEVLAAPQAEQLYEAIVMSGRLDAGRSPFSEPSSHAESGPEAAASFPDFGHVKMCSCAWNVWYTGQCHDSDEARSAILPPEPCESGVQASTRRFAAETRMP